MLAAMRRASSLVAASSTSALRFTLEIEIAKRLAAGVSQSVAGSSSCTDARRASVALSSSASPVSIREFHKSSELPRTKRRLTDAATKNAGNAPLFSFRALDVHEVRICGDSSLD
jgi:hypothetical protein